MYVSIKMYHKHQYIFYEMWHICVRFQKQQGQKAVCVSIRDEQDHRYLLSYLLKSAMSHVIHSQPFIITARGWMLVTKQRCSSGLRTAYRKSARNRKWTEDILCMCEGACTRCRLWTLADLSMASVILGEISWLKREKPLWHCTVECRMPLEVLPLKDGFWHYLDSAFNL